MMDKREELMRRREELLGELGRIGGEIGEIEEELWGGGVFDRVGDYRDKPNSIFGWYGGKRQLGDWIVGKLEGIRHRRYVEVFGGAGNVLMRKGVKPLEVYNDLDGGLVGFFRILADREKFLEFYRRVVCLVYSRGMYELCRANWEWTGDEVEKAVRWWIVARMSFSGVWGAGVSMETKTSSKTKMSAMCSKWIGALLGMPWFHERMVRVQIEQLDWREIFKRYDKEDTLFYCDPPYIHSTRVQLSRCYAVEMGDSDHEDLVDRLIGLKGKGVVSGYDHAIYGRLEREGWRREARGVISNAAGVGKGKGAVRGYKNMGKAGRTEVIWFSPGCDADPWVLKGL